LAGRESREAFARSMRVVDDNETVLRDQLAQITGIVDWLRPNIRRDVSSYLASVSPDYCRLLQIAARLDDWERAFHVLPELLTAFARDLKAMRLTLAPDRKSQPSVAVELASLRESAERLQAQQSELQLIEKAALALAPAGIGAKIAFPPLPDLQRVAWVSRLAVIPPEKALVEVTGVEKETRDFIRNSTSSTFALLETNREACDRLVSETLEGYWNDLRAHARKHYVEEREVVDIIGMLSERYVDADIRRRQQALSVDPFSSG